MSKFGVGVGDDFPVDDGNANAAAGDESQRPDGADDREDFEEWKRRRAAHRAQREQWRAQREEWRGRKHAFKEKVRAAARDSFGRDWEDYRYRGRHRRFGFGFWPLTALIPILVIVLFVSLIAAIFKSPFLFLALALLGFFFFGHRFHHRFDHARFDHGHFRHGRDYDVDLKPSSSTGQTPPAPPPAPQDGGK